MIILLCIMGQVEAGAAVRPVRLDQLSGEAGAAPSHQQDVSSWASDIPAQVVRPLLLQPQWRPLIGPDQIIMLCSH